MLNLAALGFTVVLSGFLLIWVDWRALDSDCVKADTCDISEVNPDPLLHPGPYPQPNPQPTAQSFGRRIP